MTSATPKFTGTFVSDEAHSSFQFAVRHMKVALFRASFDDADARIVADDSGIKVEGAVRVESISIRKPVEFRDHVLYGPDFLDGKNHTEITYSSNDITLAEDGTATAVVDLTIKGITKSFTATGTYQLPIEDPFGMVRAGVELSAKIDRREWDLSWQAPLPGGGDALGNEVELTVHLDLIKEA
ncbi:MAG: YceI family protein [Actinomycetota bacterium]|nr:YceI family protein [Actinomycetota bacterium]